MGSPTKEDLERFYEEELKAMESVVRAARRVTRWGAHGSKIDGLINALTRLDRWRRLHK